MRAALCGPCKQLPGSVFVEASFGRCISLAQALCPLVVASRHREFRPGLRNLCFGVGDFEGAALGVDHEQHVTRRDCGPFAREQIGDLSDYLGGNGRFGFGGELSCGLNAVDDVATVDVGDHNRWAQVLSVFDDGFFRATD